MEEPIAVNESKWEKERKARQAAMKKRLAKIGTDNPIVKEAITDQDPDNRDKKWKEWEIVDNLVHAARCKFMDDGFDFNKSVKYLSEALNKLSQNKSIDKGKNKVENIDSEDID